MSAALPVRGRLELPLVHTRGFVAEGHGATIFAFAGTDPLVPANWFTDFDFRLIPGMATPDAEVTPGTVHRGFERGVGAVWDQIVAAMAGRARTPVVITGHSLGAALAAVVADRVLSEVGVRANGVSMPSACRASATRISRCATTIRSAPHLSPRPRRRHRRERAALTAWLPPCRQADPLSAGRAIQRYRAGRFR